jgi:hypothetical protein
VIRADYYDISEPVRNQLDPANDEGADDKFADLAVGLHERQQMLVIQLDHFAGLTDARSEERGTARKHVDLASELTRSMDRDEHLGGAGWPDNLDLTCRHDEEGHDLLPASMSISPGPIERTCPCAAIRSICAGVKVGNIRSPPEACVNGTGSVRSVMSEARLFVVGRRPGHGLLDAQQTLPKQ